MVFAAEGDRAQRLFTEEICWKSSSDASTPLNKNKAALLISIEQRPSRSISSSKTALRASAREMSTCQ
jgi:hypothetical protein